MTQSLSIQPEMPGTASARKPSTTGGDGAAGLFGNELDRRLQPEVPAGEGPRGRPDGGTAVSDASAAAKDAAGDGNNLPPEEVVAETGEQPVAPSPHEDDAADPVGEAQSGEETDAEPLSLSSPVEAAPPSAAAGGSEAGRPVTATTPGQQAATDEPDADARAERAIKPAAPRSGWTPIAAGMHAQPEGEGKTAIGLDKDGKPVALRADILEALSRRGAGEGAGPTLRNLIAARLGARQQGEAMAAQPAGLGERPLQPPVAPPASPGFTLAPPASSSASGETASQPGLTVQPALHSAAWSKVMSSRVLWMAREGVQQAELRLNPAKLGPVEVRLHVQNDQASVTFLSSQAATREALEQALPRLREAFAESGITLGQAEVAEQHQQQREESEQGAAAHIFAQADATADDTVAEADEAVTANESPLGLSVYA